MGDRTTRRGFLALGATALTAGCLGDDEMDVRTVDGARYVQKVGYDRDGGFFTYVDVWIDPDVEPRPTHLGLIPEEDSTSSPTYVRLQTIPARKHDFHPYPANRWTIAVVRGGHTEADGFDPADKHYGGEVLERIVLETREDRIASLSIGGDQP